VPKNQYAKMPDPIIKVENLSKSYIINHEGQERYTALRDVVTNAAKKLFSFPSTLLTQNAKTPIRQNSSKEEFWALKDINFEINKGDRVGIIGRNGAGKSTLLKVLSRITEPTKGSIKIKGRVASLLEVGTGFHPELTGRENIFLNGAILGMSRDDIKRKFDEIVDFAEVERFLDTPVKRYSSGMYVRLAFAVAAHLEPEILIVDEVLAVGDAQFQKKCLGKMEDVSNKEGRTILFVSHNLSSLIALCNKSILLNSGNLLLQSSLGDCIKLYQSSFFNLTKDVNKNTFELNKLIESKKVQFKSVDFKECSLEGRFGFQLSICLYSRGSTRVGLNIFLKDKDNSAIAIGCLYNNNDLIALKDGVNWLQIETEYLNIAHGKYKMSMEVVIPGFETFDKLDDAILFELTNEAITEVDYTVDQNWGYGSFEIRFSDFSICSFSQGTSLLILMAVL